MKRDGIRERIRSCPVELIRHFDVNHDANPYVKLNRKGTSDDADGDSDLDKVAGVVVVVVADAAVVAVLVRSNESRQTNHRRVLCVPGMVYSKVHTVYIQ